MRGNWLNTKNANEGSLYHIDKVEKDYTSFEGKRSLICFVTEVETGDEWKARIGPEAYFDLKDILGTEDWIGAHLIPTKFKHYPGLGKSGIIWGAQARRKAPTTKKQTPRKKNQKGEAPLLPETKTWLRENSSLIGSDEPIDPETWNNTSKEIRQDLKSHNIIEMRQDYPYVAERAKALLTNEEDLQHFDHRIQAMTAIKEGTITDFYENPDGPGYLGVKTQ